jgi:putative DNA primase/helicase
VPIALADLDKNDMLLSVSNGVLDLETGRFFEPRRSDLITRAAPVVYDADASCPEWERFMKTTVPDAEVRGFVQRVFGYCLTGMTREQKWFLLYGEGSNGKSTMLDTFRGMMGQYGTVLPPRLLEEKKFEQHPTEFMPLVGARIAIGSEPRKGGTWNAELFKQFTGDAGFMARGIGQDMIERRITFKLFLSANGLPNVNDPGHGFWRRIIPIPFLTIIAEGRRDPRLLAKLAAEYSGILNWALRGLAEYLRAGLLVPSACTLAAEGYRKQVDMVQLFVSEMCLTEEQRRELKDERGGLLDKRPCIEIAKELYDEFKRWFVAQVPADRPMSQTAFGRQLTSLGFPAGPLTGNNRVSTRLGLRLWKGAINQEMRAARQALDEAKDIDAFVKSLGTFKPNLKDPEV